MSVGMQVNPFSLGLDADCCVPKGAVVLEIKICELCGKPFCRRRGAGTQPALVPFLETVPEFSSLLKRGHGKLLRGASELRRDHGERFCRKCLSRTFMIQDRAAALKVAQQEHEEQLPDLQKIHRSSHPIRYDDSLTPPVGRLTAAYKMSRSVPPRKTDRHMFGSEWVAPLLAELKRKGEMTLEEMCAFSPRLLMPVQVYQALRWRKIKIYLVRRLPTPTGMGRGPGVYSLEPPAEGAGVNAHQLTKEMADRLEQARAYYREVKVLRLVAEKFGVSAVTAGRWCRGVEVFSEPGVTLAPRVRKRGLPAKTRIDPAALTEEWIARRLAELRAGKGYGNRD